MKHYLPPIKKEPVIEEVTSSLSAESIFSNFAYDENSAFLNSSLQTDAARYSFIGVSPFFTIRTRANNISMNIKGNDYDFEGNPFEVLRSSLNAYKLENPSPFPFAGGGIGYFSYDLKNLLEELPQNALDDVALPEVYFVFYRALIIFDKLKPGKIYISALDFLNGKSAHETINEIKRIIRNTKPAEPNIKKKNEKVFLESNFTKEKYTQAVEKVLEHIKAGDIYQACLTQRFRTKWPHDAYELYLKLNRINPSPFSSFLNTGDSTIISSSPELFLRRQGNTVETRPMKGTRPRGKTPEEDSLKIKELENSQKDTSELLMIVDLERNDLGRIALPGSVKVLEQRRIESYPTVYQTIAIVQGELSPETDNIDIIKAAFPGGSITGCPKIRAMEIIDSLEPTSRGVYTGAIGYISFHNTMDLNIAIRTMVKKDTDLYFGVGGGIVSDSDPISEYEETLVKARALIESLS